MEAALAVPSILPSEVLDPLSYKAVVNRGWEARHCGVLHSWLPRVSLLLPVQYLPLEPCGNG